jgi:tetratricopeptide (TPR) repeat protein
LQATFFARQRNGPFNMQAEALLKQALEIDPDFVPAWLALAEVYFFSSALGVRQAAEAAPLVREAAEQALQLDGSNADAHLALARVALITDHNFDLAAKEVEIARRLAPDHSLVYVMTGRMAFIMGKREEGIRNVERAHELDPLADLNLGLAGAYYSTGRKEEALKLYEQRAQRRPFGARSYSNWARVLLREGDYDRALALLENENADGHQAAGRALVYQAMGETTLANEQLEILIALGERWTFELAEVSAYLGDADMAFEWLDRAIDRSDQSLQGVLTTPFLDSLRDDPRFDEVLERLGLKVMP